MKQPISGTAELPSGDTNGLLDPDVLAEIREDPGGTHVVVGIIDARDVLEDTDTKLRRPKIRFRSIEVVTSSAGVNTAADLIAKARARRARQGTLPVEGDAAGDDTELPPHP